MANEMREMLAAMDLDKNKVSEAFEAVYEACPMSAATGRLTAKNTTSTSHISKGFIEEVQFDFSYAEVYGKKREIMNIVDMGTRYGEFVIADGRANGQMKREF